MFVFFFLNEFINNSFLISHSCAMYTIHMHSTRAHTARNNNILTFRFSPQRLYFTFTWKLLSPFNNIIFIFIIHYYYYLFFIRCTISRYVLLFAFLSVEARRKKNDKQDDCVYYLYIWAAVAGNSNEMGRKKKKKNKNRKNIFIHIHIYWKEIWKSEQRATNVSRLHK